MRPLLPRPPNKRSTKPGSSYYSTRRKAVNTAVPSRAADACAGAASAERLVETGDTSWGSVIGGPLHAARGAARPGMPNIRLSCHGGARPVIARFGHAGGTELSHRVRSRQGVVVVDGR